MRKDCKLSFQMYSILAHPLFGKPTCVDHINGTAGLLASGWAWTLGASQALEREKRTGEAPISLLFLLDAALNQWLSHLSKWPSSSSFGEPVPAL